MEPRGSLSANPPATDGLNLGVDKYSSSIIIHYIGITAVHRLLKIRKYVVPFITWSCHRSHPSKQRCCYCYCCNCCYCKQASTVCLAKDGVVLPLFHIHLYRMYYDMIRVCMCELKSTLLYRIYNMIHIYNATAVVSYDTSKYKSESSLVYYYYHTAVSCFSCACTTRGMRASP